MLLSDAGGGIANDITTVLVALIAAGGSVSVAVLSVKRSSIKNRKQHSEKAKYIEDPVWRKQVEQMSNPELLDLITFLREELYNCKGELT